MSERSICRGPGENPPALEALVVEGLRPLSLHFFDVEVLGIAAQDAEGHGADPDLVQTEAGEAGGVVVRSARERLVELTELDVPLYFERSLRGDDVDGNPVVSLRVEEGEEVVRSGHHLEVAAVAVPRHVDVPAVVRILDEGEGVLPPAVGEYAFYEVVDRAEVVDEV